MGLQGLFRRPNARGVCIIALLVIFGEISPVLADTVTGSTGTNTALENRQPTLATYYIIATQGIIPDAANTGPAGNTPPDRTSPFIGEIKAIPFNFAPGGWMLCEGQSMSTGTNAALFALLGYTFGGSGTSFNLPDLRERVPMGAGQGAGLPNYQLGNVVGIKNPVLSVANLPAHTHTIGAGNTASTGSATPFDNRQPSLALHFLIAGNGEIMIVAWPREPSGWSHCDGRLLDPTVYNYLYGNIATTYGGNGSTTFALPDLRGRVVIGDDGGLWPLGLLYGNEDTVLTISAIAAHTHTTSGGATGSTGGPSGTANNFQPSLALHQLISLFGVYPTGSGASFPMVGEMRLIAGPTAPGLAEGQWVPINGQLEQIAENETLFNLIGTTYGGDGQNTFALPDLRSRVDAGLNNGTGFPLATFLGTGGLNISIPQLAAHTHAMIPEITVEQPVGTALADGNSTVDFGTVGGNGGNVVKTFTIRNVGANNLTLGSITKDGTNIADFAVGSLGSSTVVPGGNTTFTVTFSPAAAGSKSAAIHIPSNDTNQTPFDIALLGKRLTHQEDWRLLYFNDTTNSGNGADANDFEHDGLTNAMEFAVGGDPKHSTVMPGVPAKVGSTMTFSYQRAKGAVADGFAYHVEYRPDLTTGLWSNSGVSEQITSQDANFEQVKASLDISGAPNKGFMRLNVTPP